VVNFHEKLLTPPVKCGLLPGTFRADLLEKGKIREEVITVEQLKSNNGIYIINSVRKWREAILISD
jgi:para-aminobenzoate synthetase/4-amino-4-deoxychorismate lyase